MWLIKLLISAITGAWLKWRSNRDQKIGHLEERAEGQAKVIKDVEVRNEVDASVARQPDPAGELLRKWSRD